MNPQSSSPHNAHSRPLSVVPWGILAYDEAHRRQLQALDDRIAGRIPDTVFLVEHPHVFTFGRASRETRREGPRSLFGESVAWVSVERGGDVTYHGPGQLVAYPVVDIRAFTGDLHRFLHWLEDVIIRTVAVWDIIGDYHDEHTGVWVGKRKIASIGIAVKRWISYHGIALNVSTDLRFFGAIKPCGLPAATMTSMEQLCGRTIPVADVARVFSECLTSPAQGLEPLP